ncbi:ABC transporter G family member [Elsinoe australis]|uniref:ABC transporter G family member n=1 Tax=Elsinoe australis TaxID=40998 RepID=A0A2P8A8B4_9PEZI|nr:ABC transporter G family member [Elsinoe australis]
MSPAAFLMPNAPLDLAMSNAAVAASAFTPATPFGSPNSVLQKRSTSSTVPDFFNDPFRRVLYWIIVCLVCLFIGVLFYGFVGWWLDERQERRMAQAQLEGMTPDGSRRYWRTWLIAHGQESAELESGVVVTRYGTVEYAQV